jgi:hypothetical protein
VRKRPAALACLALGGGAAGLALAAFGPASTGCTTHQCDESFYEWPLQQILPDGGVMAGGFMQDENTYVTNDWDSPWLVFRGNTTVKLWFPPEVAGRHPKLPVVAVGTDNTPNSLESQEAGANFTDGIGQLAIFNDLNTRLTIADAGGECAAEGGADGSLDGGSTCSPVYYGGSVEITNSSCASYFMHVEVDFELSDAGAVESSSTDSGSSTVGAEPGIDAGAGAVVDSGVGPVAEASAGDAGTTSSD